MIARTTPGTHNPRISTQTVTHRLPEIDERPPYTMSVLYVAFLFWPSICSCLSYTQRKDRSTNSLAEITQYQPNYSLISTSEGSKIR